MNKSDNKTSTARRFARFSTVLGLTAAVLCGEGFAQAKPKVLDFWAVGGFAHGSRTPANALLDSLAIAMNFELVKAEVATVMTAANLAQYTVVLINNSTELGKLLNTDQRAALLGFMEKHGYVGFHGSGDTKGSFPDYTTYLGGELSSHGGGIAHLDKDPAPYAKNHPVTKGMVDTISFDEEWYAYKTNPRNALNIHVLYTLDENSCPGCVKMSGTTASDHPVVWVKEPAGGGRTLYYAMGHSDNIFKKNEFTKKLLVRALQWTSNCAIQNPKDPMDCGTSSIKKDANPNLLTPTIRGFAGSIRVETPNRGSHRVELATLSGKRVASRSGTGTQGYTFDNLHSGTVYSVSVYGKTGRQSSLIAVP